MMLKTTTLMLMSLSMPLSVITSPLTLGLYILMMTVTITMITSMSSTSWLAMTIFLVYVGGLLVLFAYFMAIQPNQLNPSLTVFMLSLVSFMWLYYNLTPMNSSITQSNKMFSMPYIMSNDNIQIVIILGLVLLLALVVVVKMTHMKSGPLRPFS